jgi:hypothetical protein
VHRGGDDWSRGGHGGATGGSGVAMPRYGGDRSGGSAAPRSGDGHGTNVAGRRTSDDKGDAGRSGKGDVPSWSRPREGHEPVGTAVPRTSPPERRGGGTFGGYVPNYYDPWWLYGAGYGYGYYDPFYDPWYGGYPGYSQTYSSYDEGSLRLKIKPRQAQVYVDGYYVGIVDDFDGIFQRLHIEAGTHRIEVRAPGYEPLTFDVRIEADHTTTYQGELKRLQ